MSHLDDLPRLNKRTPIVTEARNKLMEHLLELRQRYELTYLESLKILNELAADELRYAIRVERHPKDPTKNGDEE